ncbi:MAG: DUF2802 domain-containing protein, partial [Magnetococcales bacterium]|nr:DUF2802 domain-containing protein [Magnetococcales bacterium]
GPSLAEIASVVRREVDGLRKHMEVMVEAVPGSIQPELEALRRELRYLERALAQPVAPPPALPPMQRGREMLPSSPPPDSDDPYEKARQLLARGEDEERVIEETGLSVEEVSLLMRLIQERK